MAKKSGLAGGADDGTGTRQEHAARQSTTTTGWSANGDLADKLITQLGKAAVAGQPCLHRRLDIPAGGLAVHPGLSGHLPQTRARKPSPEHLTDLSHGNLPECHPQNPQVDRLEGTGYRK
jgi:hypothetical protein